MIANRYELLDQLGKGGMGVVFTALDRLSGQTVALKRVRVAEEELQFMSKSTDDDPRVALAIEFRTLASLRHPYIISVLDYGFTAEKGPYYTMPLVPGSPTITQVAAQRDEAGKVHLLLQTLQALTYLHRRGVIHRDLKPANVLVDADDTVKVMDFGLALAPVGSLRNLDEKTAGTPAYMAPELFSNHPASVASDLFALGMIAYEIFAGQYPFNTNNVLMLMMAITTERPDPHRLPPHFAPWVMRLLEHAPQDRFRDALSAMNGLKTAARITIVREDEAVRESFLQASHFVGRRAELDLLRDELDTMLVDPRADGRHALVLVGGESGVGKSRLLDELRVRAMTRGALVLRGQAVVGHGLPYQIWREPLRRAVLAANPTDKQASVLREIVPDISQLLERPVPQAAPLSAEAQQTRLTSTIGDLFARLDMPTLLLLEDLQWAAEGLEVLRALSLSTQAAGWPLLIVASFRSDEMAGLKREFPRALHLHLERLHAEEVEALSESILGPPGRHPDIVRFLQNESEGNVFFMVEILRALAEGSGSLDNILDHLDDDGEMPAHIFTGGLEAIIQQRLDRVRPADRPLLDGAAVAGRQIDLDVLAQLAPRLGLSANGVEPWLLRCAESAVLEAYDGVWRFTHDKLREFILNELPPDQRASLHELVARAIEQAHPQDDAYAELLIQHYRACGNANNEVYYILRVAENNVRVSAEYMQALILLHRALELLDRIPMGALYRPVALRWLGEANRRIGDNASAERYFRESLQLAEANGAAGTAAEALNGLGQALIDLARYDEAAAACERARQIFQAERDEIGLSDSLHLLGHIARLSDKHALSSTRAYFERALQLREALDDPQRIAASRNDLGRLLTQLDEKGQAYGLLSSSLSLYREIGDQLGIGAALANLGMLEQQRGHPDRATAYLREARDVAISVGNGHFIAQCHIELAESYYAAGDPVRAAAELRIGLIYAQGVHSVALQERALLLGARVMMASDEATLADRVLRFLAALEGFTAREARQMRQRPPASSEAARLPRSHGPLVAEVLDWLATHD